MKAFFLLLPLLLLVGCGQPSQESAQKQESEEVRKIKAHPSDVSPVVVDIIFNADFQGGSSQGTNETFDLYSARLNLETGEVRDVVQLVASEEQESVPTVDPHGRWASFNRIDGEKDLGIFIIDLQTREVTLLLSDGKNSEFSRDGNQVVYSGKRNILYLADVAQDGSSFKNTRAVTTQEQGRFAEPGLSYDGSYVVAYKFNEKHVSVAVIDVITGEAWEITPEDGTGHCNFSPDTYQIVCDKGDIQGVLFDKSDTPVMKTFVEGPSKEAIAALDEDFGVCKSVSLNYPNFCADSDHLLVSISCKIDPASEHPNFSKLFLYRVDAETLLPLGQSLAEAFGDTGFSSKIASCTKPDEDGQW